MTYGNGFRFPIRGKGIFLKGLATFLIGIILGLVLLDLTGLPVTTIRLGHPVLLRFSSYEELKAFLNKSRTSSRLYYKSFRPTLGTITLMSKDSGCRESPVEYSRTNIQVEGVDEADIIKTDGEYIYLASGNNVTIVKAYPPEEAEVVAHLELNGTVEGIYINGQRLVVFEIEFPGFPHYRTWMTYIRVYDVADRRNPIQVRSVSTNGSYFDSRMIGDYVYVLVNQPVRLKDGEVRLPIFIKDGETEEIPASRIYYSNVSSYYYGLTTIIAINVQDESVEPVYETFLFGSAREIYVSLDNIYIAIPKYESTPNVLVSTYDVVVTEIHRIHIEGNKITYEASGEVPGYILNQFSMNEYEGYFRIATTTRHVSRLSQQATSRNHVYVLSLNLTIVGKLENLAPGERIYSTRFVGKRCYLVTFKKVDPLFVISLEDPTNPKVLGKLKIPGYSDYLHPYDENHVIGIGKATVEAEEGDFAWYQGVKISLFDVSDVENPKEIANFIIGDRGTDSPVLRDHKALLFDKERNLLALPVLVAEIDEQKYPNGVPPNTYGDYVWQGVYVFNITDSSITLRGRITHIEDENEFLKSGYYFFSEYSIRRSLYIEDVLYTISDKKIKMNSLVDLHEINEVELP